MEVSLSGTGSNEHGSGLKNGIAVLSFNLVLFSCFVFSGGGSLIYETVWLRKLVLVFGSTTFSISCVLSSFMAGLGAGSMVAGRLIDKFNPDRLSLLSIYAVIELIIGVCGLSLPFCIEYFIHIESFLFGSLHESYYFYNVLIFCLILLLLLFPTMLMGATFPVMCKILVKSMESKGKYLSFLYFLNTLGGVIGVAVCGFYLLPFKGMVFSNTIAVTVNFAIALISLLLVVVLRKSGLFSRIGRKREKPENTVQIAAHPKTAGGKHEGLICAAIFSIGVVSMSLEIALTKYLSLFLGPDTYVFCIMLITFLLGITLGSMLINLVIRKIADTLLVFGIFQLFTGFFCFAGVMLYKIIPWLYVVYFNVANEYGFKSVLVKLLLCSLAMLVPTIFIGALFPLALNYCTSNLKRLGSSIGVVYLSNTLGSVIGSFSCAFIMIPVWGIQNTIYATVFVNIVAGLICIAKSPGFNIRSLHKLAAIKIGGTGGLKTVSIRFFPVNIIAILAILCSIGFFFIPEWNRGIVVSGPYVYGDKFYDRGRTEPPSLAEFTDLHEKKGRQIVYYREGINSVVSVARKPNGKVSLKVNGKVDAGTGGDMKDQVLLAQIPMITASAMNGKLDRVLCIGFGSGVSLNVMSSYDVNHARVVELEEAVLEASAFFAEVNDNVLQKKHVDAIVNDARNYLLLTREKYDVIISEPSNPFISGAAKLFTREFYEIGRSKLTENGVFAQWIPLYGFDAISLKAVLKSFISVFPDSLLFNYSKSNVVLLGFTDKPTIDAGKIRELFYREKIRRHFMHERVNVKEYYELFAMFNMGSGEIRNFVGNSRENNDDNSLVEYLSPLSLNRSNRKSLQKLMKKHSSTIIPYLTNTGNPKETASLYFNISNLLRNYEVNSELSARYFESVPAENGFGPEKLAFSTRDIVKLRENVKNPVNGWGCLKNREQHGIIGKIVNDREVLVTFGNCIGMLFEKSELERVVSEQFNSFATNVKVCSDPQQHPPR